MFEFLTGKVTAIQPDYLVLAVGPIGFRLLLGNPYQYHEGDTVTIYVEQIIRETEQVLYGFRDQAEKALFDQLTSVSGIGPKSALAILATDDHQGLLMAIRTEDVRSLTKFPGVGKKTAQQIILDLKDKVGQSQTATLFTPESVGPATANPILADGLAALAALGYSQRELDKIEPQLAALDLSTADAYVRAGLKQLSH